MTTNKPTAPRWISVRLGDDLNWWLDRTDDELDSEIKIRGVLDPRQLAHLVAALDEYRLYGYRRPQLAAAFAVFALESELSEGLLRLAATDETIFDNGAELFALPLSNDDGTGAYDEFLDSITAARVRKLNATHHYANNCTEDDLVDELHAIDSDRYFSTENIHVFNEISEILEWSPAEWEDSSSS